MSVPLPPGAIPPDLPRWLSWMVGPDPTRRALLKVGLVRLLIVVNLLLTTSYILWRAQNTVNWAVWPFSVALLGAELFSFVDTWLFCLGMWRMRIRGEPPAAPGDATVDVLITCYTEPVELVRATARAAREIRHPHQTWVLDDGDSAAMRAMAEAEGIGYLTRVNAWQGKDRHAKAGNLINALYRTEGEFLLVLDADQIPDPNILARTLGYFDDPRVAFVQTPQWFYNVPQGDPFGVAAPLFYGPILQGKDGWNSAFFCGSNAVLRRDALMQCGLRSYTQAMESRVRVALGVADRMLRRAAASTPSSAAPTRAALAEVRHAVQTARSALAQKQPLQEVTWAFQRELQTVSQAQVAADLRSIAADLAEMPGQVRVAPPSAAALRALAANTHTPLAAISAIRDLLATIDLHRDEEAEPVLPLATISVTEDMATAMRLHAAGFASVYHNEVLAAGLAPDDLRSVLQQRLRWAQGTMQVLLRENPLFQSGLTVPQRLMYFSTMWTYLSGFASVVYLVSPIVYLVFGLLPIRDPTGELLLRLLPCLVVNQLLFSLIGHGMPTWRGQQYSIALFPIWIGAVVTAIGNVYFGRKLGFVVTPKTRQGGAHWALIRPQLAMTGLLAIASVYGLTRLAVGLTDQTLPTVINVIWAWFSIAMLSVVLRAAVWQPPPSAVAGEGPPLPVPPLESA